MPAIFPHGLFNTLRLCEPVYTGEGSSHSQVKRMALLGVGTMVHHLQWASTGPRAQGYSWERGTVLMLGKKIKQRKLCAAGDLGSPQEHPEQGSVWKSKVCLLPKLRGMVCPLHRLP